MRVERVLSRQEGVENAAVNLANATASVRVYDEVDVESLSSAVGKIGYGLTPRVEGQEGRDAVDMYSEEERRQRRLFWVALVFTAPAMALHLFGPHEMWNSIVQGILVMYSCLVVFSNLLSDILYAVVDPRIRYN